jgi:membrane protease subunit HflC
MKMVYSLPVLAILLATAMSSIFVVDVREKVLVLQFGEVKQVVDEPGLYFKAPFIQEVFRYDDRILGLVTDPQEITFADQRRLVVDAFARWRIVDLQKFRRAVGLGGIDEARNNLSKIVNPEVRDVLGSVPLQSVLSEDRVALMNKIRDNARAKAATLGIDVIDVRLTRTDLPQQNLNATYSRMQANAMRPTKSHAATKRRKLCGRKLIVRRWKSLPKPASRPKSSVVRPMPSVVRSIPKPMAKIPSSTPSPVR